jgi:HTH-type transcriptional regulator, sugar sensing transcriptional regulator
LKSEEQIKTLIELGLTLDEPRIYFALIQAGPATAKTISEISKIAKPDIYRVLPTLQKKGTIEKLITKPVRFKAIPMAHALPELLKSKELKQNQLRKKTLEMLSEIKKTNLTILSGEKVDFEIVPGKVATIKRMKEELLKAQSSVCVVTSQNRFSAAILEFGKIFAEILERGVTIKLVADQHLPQKKILRIMQNLSNYPNFEVKFFEDYPSAIVGIFDNKQTYVTLSAMTQLAEGSALWSNNLSFTSLARYYFEGKWSIAHPVLDVITETNSASSVKEYNLSLPV